MSEQHIHANWLLTCLGKKNTHHSAATKLQNTRITELFCCTNMESTGWAKKVIASRTMFYN